MRTFIAQISDEDFANVDAETQADILRSEIVRRRDCKHHHTSEMYEYCDVIAVKGRRQRTVEYCAWGERKGGDSE